MKVIPILLVAFSFASLPACGGGGKTTGVEPDEAREGVEERAPDATGEPVTEAQEEPAPEGKEEPASEPRTPVEIAHGVVEGLREGDYEGATADFDETMQAALPPPHLQIAWARTVGALGEFQRQGKTRTEKFAHLLFVFIPCEFEKGEIVVKVVISPEIEVTGLFFQPAYRPPQYLLLDSFTDTEVTVGRGEWAIPGTLSVPVGEGPFPAVVLVHGSGPQDRDVTIGPNKPFKDIAGGLASRGIAVLRYEKRTRFHSEKLLASGFKITAKEETIDDVINALRLLRATKKIDREGLFVVGHSCGGMMLPRIANDDPNVAGLVFMAALTRPIDETLLEQSRYVAEFDGMITVQEQAMMDQLARAVEAIQALDPEDLDEAPETMLGGTSPEYWLDLMPYRATEETIHLDMPMLILQGERDYQVTMVDFENWKKALSGREGVEFRSYPSLNHLFIAGEGRSGPGEYLLRGNVSEDVIRDIAHWIESIVRPRDRSP